MSSDDRDVPVPVDSGSREEQAPESGPSAHALVRVDTGAMSGTIGEISAAGIRGMAGMALLEAFARYMEGDLERLREDLEACRVESQRLNDLYRDERESAAVLRSQLEAQGRLKILQNVLLTVGALMAGWGLQAAPGSVDLPTVFSGAALLLAGWLWPLGRKEAN